MINRNTASKAWYIFENIYWLLLFMWVYNVQLFYPLPGHSYEESKLALWIVAVTLDVIGVIATFNCRRNDVSTLSNTVLPFELYKKQVHRSIQSSDAGERQGDRKLPFHPGAAYRLLRNRHRTRTSQRRGCRNCGDGSGLHPGESNSRTDAGGF